MQQSMAFEICKKRLWGGIIETPVRIGVCLFLFSLIFFLEPLYASQIRGGNSTGIFVHLYGMRQESQAPIIYACCVFYAAFRIFELYHFASAPPFYTFMRDAWFVATVVCYLIHPPSSRIHPGATLLILGILAGVMVARSIPAASSCSCFFTDTIPLLFLFAVLFWPKIEGTVFTYRGAHRWTGPYWNPNRFGLFMGCGLLIAINLAYQQWRVERQFRSVKIITPLICAVLFATGLFHSYSRGAWLATGAGGLAYFLLLLRRERGLLITKLAFGVVAACCIYAIGMTLMQQAPIWARIASMVNTGDRSIHNRLLCWEGMIEMIKVQPWIGFGLGRAKEVFEESFMPSELSVAGGFDTNGWLQLACGGGIPLLTAAWAFVLGASLSRFNFSPIVTSDAHYSSVKNPSVFSQRPLWSGVALLFVIAMFLDGGIYNIAVIGLFTYTIERLGKSDPL